MNLSGKSAGLSLLLFLALFAAAKPARGQTWFARYPNFNSGEFFQCVACSSNGATLVVGSLSADESYGSLGQIFVSTNFGVTWQTTLAPTNSWLAVACSADGTKMVAAADLTGIYTSTNSGATWQLRTSSIYGFNDGSAPISSAGELASSADGTKLVVAGAGIYHSSNSGVTWQSPTSPGVITNSFYAVASSADGTKLVAVGSDATGPFSIVYRSSDSGVTWAQVAWPRSFSNFVSSVACSADGGKLVAAGYGVYTSDNYGVTWQQQSGVPAGPPQQAPYWSAVASSADGTRLVIGGQFSINQVYTSLDSGVTWSLANLPTPIPLPWVSVASSADGTKLAAVPYATGFGIYTVQTGLGYVSCICDSNGIPGATVQIGTNVTTTDAYGAYALTNVLPGTYLVTVRATNFATQTTNLTINANQPVPNFYLTNTTLLITAVLDASITGRPDVTTISNTIWAAIQVYPRYIADPICVKIKFAGVTQGLGQSINAYNNLPYSDYVSDLEQNTNLSANDLTALASLPAPPDTGILDNTVVVLTAANLDALGEHALARAAKEQMGGYNSEVGFNFSRVNTSRPDQNTNLYDLQSTVLHEIDEVLGIGGSGSALRLTNAYAGQTGPTGGIKSLDLYRYAGPGVRSFSLATNVSAYFSINGGANVLVYFNQLGWAIDGTNGFSADFGDWGDGTNPAEGEDKFPAQVQDAFGTPGGEEDLGTNELVALDVIGYTLIAMPTFLGVAYDVEGTRCVFATAPGYKYVVQSTASLDPPVIWKNLDTPFVAGDLKSSFTDTGAKASQQFYRVEVVPATDGPLVLTANRPAAVVPSEPSVIVTGRLQRLAPTGWHRP